ncbi:DNA polymerase I OS=Lysinibacillus sphaericus OX=1421 GN=polA PE=3 SV=1 [Lysinibacillus sphaericus]
MVKEQKRAIPASDVLAEHVSRKAFAVWTLQPKLEALLKENEQFELYKNLELPLASILSEMESEGITVNRATLETDGAGAK